MAERLAGVILGTATGDSLGLPAEGLRPDRIRARWPGPLQHRFFFGHGMCSDDTEHTWMVAQALLQEPDDPTAFARCLAWKLRFWMLALPAGVGLATARAIIRLWAGYPPDKCGVFSAGNGPAMRSAVLGAYFAGDAKRRRSFVRASTRLTHTDPKAEWAAQAVAEAAAWTVSGSQGTCLDEIRTISGDSEWRGIWDAVAAALDHRASVEELCRQLGLSRGITGYSFHTVPVAVYAWLLHRGDTRGAITAVVRCGGDTDTVAAVTGALCGVDAGAAALPGDWLGGIAEWPRTTSRMQELGHRLAHQLQSGTKQGPLRYPWPGIIPRNLLFLLLVLQEGFRRLLPF